jgi:dUTP pyrophosphatase
MKMFEPLLRRLDGLFRPNPVFELAHELATLPTRGSEESAGLDLYAAIDEPKIHVVPGQTVLVPTGLKCKFNPGWAAFLWDRSGMGFKGIHRYAGLIDSDYRGTWGVVLNNSTNDTITIKPYDRIAQVVFQRCWIGTPRLGNVSVDTKRGVGGFGSTGKGRE